MVYGNDSTASVGGLPFATIDTALANVSQGQEVIVLPGIYNLYSSITIPYGVTMRGSGTKSCILQLINVNTSLLFVNINDNCIIEDIAFILTSNSTDASTLIGWVFNEGTPTVTSQINRCSMTIDNSSINTTSNTEVYGVFSYGYGGIIEGVINPDVFFKNCINHSNIIVSSNGNGKKRGIQIDYNCVLNIRDTNILVTTPRDTSSHGTYIGIETNSNNCVIEIRSSCITACPESSGLFISADISQTQPIITSTSSYLTLPGIKIGPGTELITKNANSKGFFVYNPKTIYYGLKGIITSNKSGWLWPGTQVVSTGIFPDMDEPPAFYIIQQPCLLFGMSVTLSVPPTAIENYLKVTLQKTLAVHVNENPYIAPTDTIFTVTFSESDLVKEFYDGSVSFKTGDRLHVYIENVGSNNSAKNLTCQLNLF